MEIEVLSDKYDLSVSTLEENRVLFENSQTRCEELSALVFFNV